jgi:hypothetical protein
MAPAQPPMTENTDQPDPVVFDLETGEARVGVDER